MYHLYPYNIKSFNEINIPNTIFNNIYIPILIQHQIINILSIYSRKFIAMTLFYIKSAKKIYLGRSDIVLSREYKIKKLKKNSLFSNCIIDAPATGMPDRSCSLSNDSQYSPCGINGCRVGKCTLNFGSTPDNTTDI